ncbi:MAG: mechanosensitive ion channel domain-containing protein, partial [Bythopirellula sp.]
ADRLLLQSGEIMLQNELEMLNQEQLSQAVREELLASQQALLMRQIENSEAALKTMVVLLEQHLSTEAKRVSSLANTIPQDLPEDDQESQALAAEVGGLAQEFEKVVENLKTATAAHDDVARQLELLNREYDSIREQLKLGGGGSAMAQVLFNLESRIHDARTVATTVQLPTLGETRLARLQVEDKLRGQLDIEKQFADRSSGAIKRLVDTRQEVLAKLQTQYGSLTRALALLDIEHRKYQETAKEITAYVHEQLFGFSMRSVPPISAQTVTDLPTGLRWEFQRRHWVEFGGALRGVVTRMPVLTTMVVLAVALLLLARRRIGAALERTGEKTRRISTDHYAYTVQALVWTLLLAVPLPLLIGFLSWVLMQTPGPSDWARGVIFYGFRNAMWITLALTWVSAVCRGGGLGAIHFRWDEQLLPPCRRAIFLFAVVYIPADLLTCSTLFGDASDHFHSVGRVSFIVAHVWTAIVLWHLLRSSDGISASLAERHPARVVTRWRYLWYPLLVACPLGLVVLAAMGYLLTAQTLSLVLFATAVLIVNGIILYFLVLRWFMIKFRRLALEEALDRRRAQQEAAASEAPQEPSGEIVTVDVEEEEGLGLESMGDQTRDLLQSFFVLGVAAAVLVLWADKFPFVTVSLPMAGGLTLLGLAKAILIIVVTYVAVRNLPGLLELAVLRGTVIEAGTRNAIATLSQYAVIAIGFALLFNVLQLDWSKFGWIAAALSVGLGFGLQEVVANFVCGLILLFEQPIRVGDVVTVEGTTGTVTKIRMRSTTITNWDRQDFVVPNKSLITGTILNWTLSAPLNRVVIPVGVAYGSDTEKARQILLDVAADHPRVLDDPAPIASFEQFADSSLNLVLRAYLPNLDNRIGTISELHTEIDKRFADAGIKIPFPQRDINFRGGWVGVPAEASAPEEDGKQKAVSVRSSSDEPSPGASRPK